MYICIHIYMHMYIHIYVYTPLRIEGACMLHATLQQVPQVLHREHAIQYWCARRGGWPAQDGQHEIGNLAGIAALYTQHLNLGSTGDLVLCVMIRTSTPGASKSRTRAECTRSKLMWPTKKCRSKRSRVTGCVARFTRFPLPFTSRQIWQHIHINEYT